MAFVHQRQGFATAAFTTIPFLISPLQAIANGAARLEAAKRRLFYTLELPDSPRCTWGKNEIPPHMLDFATDVDPQKD